MKKYKSPENKTNEWVDRSVKDLHDIVNGPTALERSDHIAIINELLTRIREMENRRPTKEEFYLSNRA